MAISGALLGRYHTSGTVQTRRYVPAHSSHLGCSSHFTGCLLYGHGRNDIGSYVTDAKDMSVKTFPIWLSLVTREYHNVVVI